MKGDASHLWLKTNQPALWACKYQVPSYIFFLSNINQLHGYDLNARAKFLFLLSEMRSNRLDCKLTSLIPVRTYVNLPLRSSFMGMHGAIKTNISKK